MSAFYRQLDLREHKSRSWEAFSGTLDDLVFLKFPAFPSQ